MRFRTLALGITAIALLAVATAAPSPAAEVKKYEGTIAAPAPVVSGELSQDYATGGALRMTCPEAGEGDGLVYKFFDLGADYKFFFVSGPPSTVNQPDPAGVNGTFHDYDVDLDAYDAKCNPLELEGSINLANGIGNATVAGKTPAKYAVITYFTGPPNLPVLLEASNERIKK